MVELSIVVAVIVGVVEAIKRTGYLTSQWSSLVAIGLGIAWFAFTGEMDLAQNLFAGVMAGLMASGLYDVGKKVILNK